jgi:23S rRNA (uridine2552-2'-O)-methyltransferase
MADTKTIRNLTVHVKTAKGRSISSARWLHRQLNDPYVQKAKADGYRSRAAYKLIEINDKFKIFKKGQVVVDLGAAPGGWSQVAAQKIQLNRPWGGKLLAIDLLEMPPILGANIIQQDFLSLSEEDIAKWIKGQKVDVILSDMAASASGHTPTDHMLIMRLCEDAFLFAKSHLNEGGFFIAKILQGGTENELLAMLKESFKLVKHFKPKSSRSESAEMYVVCMGFRKRGE